MAPGTNVCKDYQTDAGGTRAHRRDDESQPVLFIALGDIGKEDFDSEWRGSSLCAYQDAPSFVARYYQAADVYVHAAKADTFPIP